MIEEVVLFLWRSCRLDNPIKLSTLVGTMRLLINIVR